MGVGAAVAIPLAVEFAPLVIANSVVAATGVGGAIAMIAIGKSCNEFKDEE